MELHEKIKTRRKELNMTLLDVAKATGVSETTVQRWEKGTIENMRRDKIVKLAKALHTSPAYLMDWTDDPNEKPSGVPANLIPLRKVRYVPVIGRIACGTPILAEQNIVDHILLPDHINADFVLQTVGDSMTGAQIDDRDYVYIRSQPEVENGEIAAVLIGDEATLKKVYREDDKLTLLPANPKHDPFVYVKDEIKRVRIIGKAVAVLKNLE